MKIIHLSTFDEIGGAAIAANRLHQELLKLQHESHMYVQKARRNSLGIHRLSVTHRQLFADLVRPRIDAMPLRFYRKKADTPFNISWLSKSLREIKTNGFDLIHVHWINGGFLSLNEISKLSSKIVISLHDSWFFTGGCHVPGECRKFQSKCTCCPQLGSNYDFDLSSFGFEQKSRFLAKVKPIFIAPSTWMMGEAKSSALLSRADIRLIPNGLNTELFRPINKSLARDLLGLPNNKKLLLFGAMSATSNPNKGYWKLKEAARLLSKQHSSDTELLVFGSAEKVSDSEFGFKVRVLGEFFDESSLALVYSAADLICVPSISESFCLVACEAMACGLPVVSFATSGLKDLNVHMETGYLARPFDSNDLAKGISLLLNDNFLRSEMAESARKRVVEKFSIKVVAKQFANVYESIV